MNQTRRIQSARPTRHVGSFELFCTIVIDFIDIEITGVVICANDKNIPVHTNQSREEKTSMSTIVTHYRNAKDVVIHHVTLQHHRIIKTL